MPAAKKRLAADSGMQYIVIIMLRVGPRYYGPFDNKAKADHWAKNNWMVWTVRPIWCTA